jgi:hypothetical protein
MLPARAGGPACRITGTSGASHVSADRSVMDSPGPEVPLGSGRWAVRCPWTAHTCTARSARDARTAGRARPRLRAAPREAAPTRPCRARQAGARRIARVIAQSRGRSCILIPASISAPWPDPAAVGHPRLGDKAEESRCPDMWRTRDSTQVTGPVAGAEGSAGALGAAAAGQAVGLRPRVAARPYRISWLHSCSCSMRRACWTG